MDYLAQPNLTFEVVQRKYCLEIACSIGIQRDLEFTDELRSPIVP
jgi:hypothetical protein